MRALRRFHPNVRTLFAAVLALLLTASAALWSHQEPPESRVRLVTAAVASLPPSTTTTTQKPPERASRSAGTVRRATTARPGPTAGNVNGYPCGGDLPPCWVLMRESRGNPRAVNLRGCSGRTCGGLWQFDPRTWAGFAGFRYAQDAPADVQNAKARLLWAGGRGCSHWAACGRRS